MTLLVRRTPPDRLYVAGKMQPHVVRFYADGWPLVSRTMKDALREASMMGIRITRVETQH